MPYSVFKQIKLFILGQALCAHCRDATHRAKMFASHELVHMTKCQKEPKRVSILSFRTRTSFLTYLPVIFNCFFFLVPFECIKCNTSLKITRTSIISLNNNQPYLIDKTGLIRVRCNNIN